MFNCQQNKIIGITKQYKEPTNREQINVYS